MDLSNYVQEIGVEAANGGWQHLDDCRRWRAAVNAGDYDYLVVDPTSRAEADDWAATDPSTELVRDDPVGRLYELTGPLDPDGCRADTS